MSATRERLDLSRPKAAPGIDLAKPEADDALEVDVPREVTIRLSWHDPELGARRKATLTSRVMDGDELSLRAQRAAAFAGVPWTHLATMEAARFYAMATVATQVRDLGTHEWLNEALKSDIGLLLALEAKLGEHQLRYFRGHVREGESCSRLPVVECPELDAPNAAPSRG